MRLAQVKRVAVIGAGIMGHSFAIVFAQKGYPVALFDVDEGILGRTMARIDASLDTLVANKLVGRGDKKKILGRITPTVNLKDAVGRVDFVLEAAPEMMELKKDLFADLDRLAPPHTILASNTSGLSITEIASATARPQKAIILHWVNPPHIIPVVEIVRGAETSEDTAQLCYKLILKLGKKPVWVRKEVPGFLFNRLQLALYREALYCLENGIASVQDIDMVVKAAYGFRSANLGPLETSDFGGLDTFCRVAANLFPDLSCAQEPPLILKRLVEEKKLGIKTGEGFYRYPASVLKRKIQERDDRLIQQLKLFEKC